MDAPNHVRRLTTTQHATPARHVRLPPAHPPCAAADNCGAAPSGVAAAPARVITPAFNTPTPSTRGPKPWRHPAHAGLATGGSAHGVPRCPGGAACDSRHAISRRWGDPLRPRQARTVPRDMAGNPRGAHATRDAQAAPGRTTKHNLLSLPRDARKPAACQPARETPSRTRTEQHSGHTQHQAATPASGRDASSTPTAQAARTTPGNTRTARRRDTRMGDVQHPGRHHACATPAHAETMTDGAKHVLRQAAGGCSLHRRAQHHPRRGIACGGRLLGRPALGPPIT